MGMIRNRNAVVYPTGVHGLTERKLASVAKKMGLKVVCETPSEWRIHHADGGKHVGTYWPQSRILDRIDGKPGMACKSYHHALSLCGVKAPKVRAARTPSKLMVLLRTADKDMMCNACRKWVINRGDSYMHVLTSGAKAKTAYISCFKCGVEHKIHTRTATDLIKGIESAESK